MLPSAKGDAAAAVRLLALVEYDGTDFSGFQLQAHREAPPRTVQAVLEQAVEAATGAASRIVGSGRTDSGVHAAGQAVHFDTASRLGREPVTLRQAMNAHLPPDVVVRAIRRVPRTFHARFSAISRTYRYRILNCAVRSPLACRYMAHVPGTLSVERMQQAAALLRGTHDFVAFAAEQGAGSTVREVLRAEVSERWAEQWAETAPIWQTLASGAARASVSSVPDPGDAAETAASGARLVEIEIEANAFLRHMMRRIVGTLLRVGQARLEPAELATMLARREKGPVGPAAPAHGLSLQEVRYALGGDNGTWDLER